MLAIPDELILQLHSPTSWLFRRDEGLLRMLSFEAVLDRRSATIDVAPDGGWPSPSVTLEEVDDADGIGWVEHESENIARASFKATLRRYTINVGLQRYAIDYADSIAARDRYLELRLKLLQNAEIVGTRHWHPDWDAQRENPRALRFVSLTMASSPP